MGLRNTFEQNKRLKEEEIKFLKLQIEQLLKNQKKLEEIIALKQKEIDEIKKYNDLQMKNMKISSQTNLIQQKHTKKL